MTEKTIKIIKWIICVITVIIILAVVYFMFRLNNSNNSSNKNIDDTNYTNEPIEDYSLVNEAKEQKVETVALVPKVEKEIPKEEPLPEGTDRFTVGINFTNESIAENLLTAGYITDKVAFLVLLDKEKIPVTSGAYKISKVMTPEQINKVLHSKPYMKWVMIKPGLRKEEIATILADTLGWTKTQKENWIDKDTTTSPEYTEGVYYPDTYLIPVAEEPALVAKRLINKFNENFSVYFSQFTAKNIKWARALTLASIVQREASSDADMPLVAGILWNRLDEGMALGVDATLQYLRGDKGSGWWAPITVAEKQTDSPFNTYKYKGLPPHPISNPGISAIEAVLNPTETDCLYYIHDKSRVTHCAVTYEEHKKNIDEYLKTE